MSSMTNDEQTPPDQIDLEEWRPCHRFLKYEVSSHGRIRNATTGKVITLQINVRTRDQFASLFTDSKKTKTVRVAPLVTRAFLGETPAGLEIDHKDGQKWNNRVTNLHFVTKSVNVHRSYHVQNLRTKEHDRSKGYLTEAEYDEVFRLSREEKLSQVQIGKRLGRHHSTICKILNGKTKPRAMIVTMLCPSNRDDLRQQRAVRIDLVRNMLAVNPGLAAGDLAFVLGVKRSTVVNYFRAIKRAK